MQTRTFARSVIVIALVLSLASLVRAADLPRPTLGGEMLYGRSMDPAKAGGDTINLMAAHDDPTNSPGEPAYFGDFEDAEGAPNWNGWTHYDVTAPTESHWNVSTYNQTDPANHAAWCGDIDIPSCGDTDPAGGYGNSWNDLIEFRLAVDDPSLGCVVTVSATLIYDTEPGYDYVYLSYLYQGQTFADMQAWDGAGTAAVSNSVSYMPAQYVDGTDIMIYFRFWSDGAWSDEDCSFPTAGGCQVDDIDVHIVNGSSDVHYLEDFEHGGDPDDFGFWNPVFPPGVGDFAKIWTGLEDLDPCATDFTPQVAFIDDGIVVPGTGGSECINWCYGPSGYIVNTTGGLAYRGHIHDVIVSPVMDWPAPKNGTGPDYDGIIFSFQVYRHEDLSADAPGVFYIWGIRSADTDGSAGHGVQDIADQPWDDRGDFVYYGGPDYLFSSWEVPDLMNPGRDQVQVQLGVYQLGWVWGWNGNDGYPAPYFDNVTVKIFPYHGPGIWARELDLAQDNFPERGSIDMTDPGSHSVRFDMANNISPISHLRNDPGDSVVVDVAAIRSGAGLDGDPLLHYIVDRNPVFDPYRTSGLPAEGVVAGRPAVGTAGTPIPDKWAFDLPDTGFLFPGDVLHYCISAVDAIGGVGGSDPQTALMPADTTGFSTGFGDPLGYNSSFTVHALPGIKADGEGGYSQEEVLFINDFANRGGEDEWYAALRHMSLSPGEGYDIYYVNAPSSGVGNGIGGRAGHLLLQDYDVILYTSGDLGVNTIANGDYDNDPGNDVATLTDWLDMGGKNMFLTGDNLASDLAQSGAATQAFVEQYMGIQVVTFDARPLIDNQMTPLVRASPGNPVFNGALQTWIAFGGCRSINTFDGVQTLGGAVRLAEFTDPGGQIWSYPLSAATMNMVGTSCVISMPVDLMFVYTDPGAQPGIQPGRVQLLSDVISYFGYAYFPDPSDVRTPGFALRATNYPNPFNPSTTIRYSMPRSGHLKLSIYNVRGQLVRTLIDGERPAGADQTVVWDGTDARGSDVPSGVYFYEARALGEVRMGKTTLLK